MIMIKKNDIIDPHPVLSLKGKKIYPRQPGGGGGSITEVIRHGLTPRSLPIVWRIFK
jgi:hypothetical protein